MTNLPGSDSGRHLSARRDLDSRVTRLQSDLADVLSEIEQLRLAHARKRKARWATSVGAGLLFVGGWTIAASAQKPPVTTAKAPFEVVDGAGKLILQVLREDGTARLNFLNSRAERVASVVAGDKGSFFRAGTPDNKWSADLGVDGTTPYFKLSSGGDTPSAERSDGDRISLDVTDGRPYMRFQVPGGHGILRLSQGTNGGGELEIAKPGGDVVVRAGISPGGVGRVEAYPLGNPLGSVIVGRLPQ
jgi:hypothetical protein